MQTQLYYNFLSLLLNEQKISAARVSRNVRNSDDFKNLNRSGIIKKERTSNGGFNYVVVKSKELHDYFNNKFPNPVSTFTSGVANVKTFKDSKAKNRKSQRAVLLRGNNRVRVNGTEVDLEYCTKHFGLFAATIESVEASRICIVENLDVFLRAEEVVSDDYTFLHSYGRLGKDLVSRLNADKFLVFSDYDFVGLKEYLLVKSVRPNTEFFMPDDYESLYRGFAKSLRTQDGREQKTVSIVKESHDGIVVRIREQLINNNKFLEQQALLEK